MSVTLSRRPARHVLGKAILLAGSTLLAASVIAWSPPQTSGWNQGAAEATLWQLLNGARVNNGIAPLQQHSTLVSIARWRSNDMLDRDYFSHTILGTNQQVYHWYDLNGLKYAWGGENIAWNAGFPDDYSPVRAHERFMASSGHRANVLNPAFTHGGVGAAARDNQMFQGYVQNTRMYTELFLQAPASQPAPPPPAPAPAPKPPSGGGPAPAAPAPAPGATAPAASAEPEPRVLQVQAPQRPRPSAELDGRPQIVSPLASVDVAARLAADDALGIHGRAAGSDTDATQAGSPMRIATATPAQRGFFEAILSTLLSFFAG